MRKGERARNERKGEGEIKEFPVGATSRTRGAIKLSIRKAAINNDKEGDVQRGEAEVEKTLSC